MNHLRITKGTDISLSVNDTTLYGVTDFVSDEKYSHYEINEFLSGEPFDTVNEQKHYELELVALSLFDFDVLTESNFTLTVCDKSRIYTYEGCNLFEKKRVADGAKNVCDKYKITAKSMTQSEVEDE